jgi:hypothetical protein
MGAEIVFEVWKQGGKGYLRVLWGGKVSKSNLRGFGRTDMIGVDGFLKYVGGLVGERSGEDSGHVSSGLVRLIVASIMQTFLAAYVWRRS